jgi:serine/threonine protein kinase/Tol biopolymer transport system component
MPVVSGTRIGPYEVVSFIGAGGMGEVYRARDPRLAREVAIKLIPEAHATDGGRVHRFEQEARAVGQLNHPNLLSVFDLGVHQGARYIVSELLEGESLRSRLKRGPVVPRQAADLGRQLSQGLAAAHDKGIVHRDIKPDNLFITSDGRLKILDFGIAKLTYPNNDAQALMARTETAEGLVVGTVSYMSPEQVRGESVDARSDIFSAGIVLYEMLTGRPVFTRDSAADTIAAVLNDPPRSALPPGVSPGLVRIIERCLEKQRSGRFQSARDLGFALEVLSDPASSDRRSGLAPSPQLRARHIATGVAAAAVVVAGILWWQQPRTRRAIENPLADARFSRFTDWPGTEAGAEISPDGRFVLFVSDRDGRPDLFVSQVGSGHFLNVTRDLEAMRFPGSILRTFGFSGDGTEIWFVQANGMAHMPLTGGVARPFLASGAAGPAWSPDQKRLAYFDASKGDALHIADASGIDARPIAVETAGFFARTVHTHNPVWSADGRWLYFAHGPDPSEEMNLWRLPFSGGRPEQLTALQTAVNFVAPIDARTLLYIADSSDRTGPWLWSLDIETRATTRVTSGLEHYSSVSASRDGTRLVTTVVNPTATLWRVPILDHPAGDGDLQRYPLARTRAFAPRVRGASLFFLAGSGPGDGLWRASGGQEQEVFRASSESLRNPPVVSPDGSQVAVAVRQDGVQRLLVMHADGTGARTLAPSIALRSSLAQSGADWSPDGRWIAAAGSDTQGPGLFKIPVDGGAPSRLVSGPIVNPVWSPDGTWIVYGGPVVSGKVPLLAVSANGIPVKVPGGHDADSLTARIGGGPRFLPDGKGLVYLPENGSLDFWMLDFLTGTTRPLTQLTDDGALNIFDLTPDGKYIVFDRSTQRADIYLIERDGR